MITENLDKQISQFLLLNVPAITDNSLVYGKSGIALALGLYGLASQDEYLVDRSGDIITEALISQLNTPTFALGWAGIGWCTLRMMDHGLIEADYAEIMGDKHRLIISHIDELKIDRDLDVRSLVGLHQYLSAYSKVLKDLTLSRTQERLFASVEQVLIQKLTSRSSSALSTSTSADIVSSLEYYLRYCIVAQIDVSEEVLMFYSRLYAKGGTTSSYVIGVYLQSILGQESDYLTLIKQNLRYGERILRTMPILSFNIVCSVLVAHRLLGQTNQVLEEYLLSHIGLSKPINEERLLATMRNEYSGSRVPVEIAKVLLYRYVRAEDIYITLFFVGLSVSLSVL